MAFHSAGDTPSGTFTIIRDGRTEYTKGKMDEHIDFTSADADSFARPFAGWMGKGAPARL